ncbi:low affinity Fe/Cu permease [Bacillus pakistanensis]|uniref:Low affinity Fe/Cu permease n=1 Tax=Rossellomorea pakistanensis TaxID=992288 RepID=A0ABS2NJB2_9BACI|nr:hypothetical protein [Bacillus pakistanensis]MBM7587890.1 low affinity Fe/Cu permease [Bacillus pakistanensis]
MDNIDKRNRLDEEIFSYRVTKNHVVFIEFHGKQIKTLKGKEAEKLINKLSQAENDKQVQLILAKVTGNFKRGNERTVNRKKN